MKFLKILILILLIVVSIGFYLVNNSYYVQDRLLERAIINLVPDQFLDEDDTLRAIVCGSRSPVPSPNRAQTCVLVEAGDDIYIVDTGDGSFNNVNSYGIPWTNVKAIIFTHLHSDHISDLADFHLQGWVNGRDGKLLVHGPEGVKSVTDGFELTYSQDYIFRNSHHGDDVTPISNAGYIANTISLETPTFVNTNDLKISAFEVQHSPVEPAYGIRFDYKGRSIVISGDTIYSENLINKSKDADVLIHEVMSIPLLNTLEKTIRATGNTNLSKILFDVQNYHATAIEAAESAKKANVGHLITYHALPAPRNNIMESIFYRGVDDIFPNFTPSIDGTMVTLPVNTDEIIISHFGE